jgi:predicted HTH domain antitoxin
MVVTLDLPDSIARALTDRSDRDLARRALEALAVDGYREQRLTQKQVGELLGLSRIETENLLAARLDLYDYDPAELTREAEQLKTFSERPR